MEEVVLRTASTESEANELIALMKSQDIEARIVHVKDAKHFIMEGYDPSNQLEVRILSKDKDKAEEILRALAEQLLEEESDDHYLHAFSDRELIDILISPDEWSEFDVLLSRKILQNRGKLPSEEQLEKDSHERQAELSQPENTNMLWIVLGYVAAILGGFIGIILGYTYWKSKRTLPNGTIVPRYSEEIREHGRIIFIVSAIVFTSLFFYRMGRNIGAF